MKKLYYTIILILIALMSCEDSSPIADPSGGQIGELYRDTLVAINDTFIVGEKVSTGLSPRLFIGSHNDVESRALIKFSTLPDDSIVVDSLYLLLQSVSHYGDSSGNIDIKIKLITKSWGEKANTDDSWSYQNDASDDPETTTNYTISTEDSLLYTIKLPDTLVSIWRDTTVEDKNHGLLLDFENANYIKEFASENSTIIPKIVYVYQNSQNDSTIRDTIGAAFDASVVDYSGNLVSDSLMYITSGYTHHAFVKFDFNEIPGLDSSIISNVNFIFTRDSLASDVNVSKTNVFYFRTVTTPYNDLPSFNVDSTFTLNLFHNITLVENEYDKIEIESIRRGETGQYFIQSIINESIEYGSFMLHYIGEGSAISVYALKGTKGIKESNKPKMIIEYYKIPNSRL